MMEFVLTVKVIHKFYFKKQIIFKWKRRFFPINLINISNANQTEIQVILKDDLQKLLIADFTPLLIVSKTQRMTYLMT